MDCGQADRHGHDHSHGQDADRNGEGHCGDAPDDLAAVQGLALGGQGLQDGGHLVGRQEHLGVDDLDGVGTLRAGAVSSRQRRDRLEPPLLVRDAAEGVVAVVDDLALPPTIALLPVGPDARGTRLEPVGPSPARGRAGAGDVAHDVDLVAVEQRAARRDGQQVQTHDREGKGSPAKTWASSISVVVVVVVMVL